MIIPLPFVAQHYAYSPGVENEDGNTVPGHLPAVPVACIWWSPESLEPSTAPVGSDRVLADVVLAIDSALQVDQRDYFTIAELIDYAGAPLRLNVVGIPKDYDHGPFGFAPGRRIVELKAVI